MYYLESKTERHASGFTFSSDDSNLLLSVVGADVEANRSWVIVPKQDFATLCHPRYPLFRTIHGRSARRRCGGLIAGFALKNKRKRGLYA